MTDYKNYKPKTDYTPVIEGVCFVLSMAMLAFLYLLIGA
jgi:hypothetical protein